jgi:hypothetical protein
MRVITRISAVLAMLCAMAGQAAAQVAPVTEIDASVVPAAVGLVSAGVLMLRARRRSR